MQSLFVAAFLEDYPSHQQRYSYPAPRLLDTSCDDSDLNNTAQGIMDDPRNSIFDVQSGINALCVYLADVVQNGSSDVRDKLIDLLHKLVSGEATSTIFADFSVPGQKSRIFLIADSEEQQMRLLREFEAQLEQQIPPLRRRKTASALVIPFPSQTATEEPV